VSAIRLTRREAFIGGGVLGVAAALGVASTGSPFAGTTQTITFWHLFGGGDGARLAAILDEIDAEHADSDVWNAFFWPFVVTSAGSLFTIPVGLATVQTSFGALYAQQMALAVLGALPLLVAFLLFQRQIVQGIANTGLKG
jgi:ABC-type glycerol-3-phosphate transport system substrate-binding protein